MLDVADHEIIVPGPEVATLKSESHALLAISEISLHPHPLGDVARTVHQCDDLIVGDDRSDIHFEVVNFIFRGVVLHDELVGLSPLDHALVNLPIFLAELFRKEVVDRPVQNLFDREIRQRIVDVADALVEIEKHHVVGRAFGKSAKTFLAIAQQLLRSPSLTFHVCVGDFSLDCRNQPRKIVFQHVIGDAFTHRGNGRRLADRPGHDDDGHISIPFLGESQCLESGEAGQCIVGEYHIEDGAVQCVRHILSRADTFAHGI